MTCLCCCSERINAAVLKNKDLSHTNLDICSVSKAKQKTHLQSKEKVWLCAASSNSTPLISISLTGDDYRRFLSFFFTGNKWHSTLHLFTDSYARLFYIPQQNILFTTKSASTARIFTRLINWNFLWWWSHTHSLYRFTESSLGDVVSSLWVKTAPPSAPDVIGFFSKLHEAQLWGSGVIVQTSRQTYMEE